ncbi:MAG: Alpha-D-kanosaminyltransferase [Pelotomaculum sp. PtaB.Bin013]|uniref:Glycosyltransferase family 4 protein n=1 Tax=Pelotomaculum isophthalicicum JI TaxID=947010 RepID=A0A9X4GYI5_9FIRM|nr:glycosyltransferase family 4 protein [Pelotomaculum isophthalicicum]MDF9407865.1 glycosyltransferase family 4 protein [Pelotomaculum isophthalicicum JI]OPX91072.1 MAG: Alpha-D-kanosaminyltransferase [Pelotomaculum sp. PtaB.Bin013]
MVIITKKLMYLTVTAPLGRPEAFLIPEMNCLAAHGVDLTIIPVRPAGSLAHKDGNGPFLKTIVSGPWSLAVWRSTVTWLLRAPLQVAGLLCLLLKGGSFTNKVKNLLLLPKGMFIAEKVQSLGITHIHAHWASTPSTCALVASALTGVGWSFTAHRWDIKNNNLLPEKVRRCSFVRVISSRGLKQVTKIIGREEERKRVILSPLGVDVPPELPQKRRPGRGKPIIGAVGSLTAVKGHRYLLHACRLLADRGVDFRCLIVGDGPERGSLSRLADRLKLGGIVFLVGALSHDRVLRMLRSGIFNLLAHPSVETPGGAHEGVPVAVMESMAGGVPVVVTGTGSVTDLVDHDTGVIVPPENPSALALAIESLLSDPDRARALAIAAHRRVGEKFELSANVHVLLGMMDVIP